MKADFEGLPSAVWTRFEVDLKACYNWDGEFKKKRKKRDVGEEEGEDGVEDGGIAKLPGNLLNWARELLPRSFFRPFFAGYSVVLDLKQLINCPTDTLLAFCSVIVFQG